MRLDPGKGLSSKLPGLARVSQGQRDARQAGEIVHGQGAFGVRLAPDSKRPRKSLGCLTQHPGIRQRVAEVSECEAHPAPITDFFLDRKRLLKQIDCTRRITQAQLYQAQ